MIEGEWLRLIEVFLRCNPHSIPPLWGEDFFYSSFVQIISVNLLINIKGTSKNCTQMSFRGGKRRAIVPQRVKSL